MLTSPCPQKLSWRIEQLSYRAFRENKGVASKSESHLGGSVQGAVATWSTMGVKIRRILHSKNDPHFLRQCHYRILPRSDKNLRLPSLAAVFICGQFVDKLIGRTSR